MTIRMTRRLLVVALTLCASVAVMPTADASEVTCSKSGSSITMTLPANTPSADLGVGEVSGLVVVWIGNYGHNCYLGGGRYAEASSLSSIDLYEAEDSTPTRWTLSETRWTLDVSIHNDPLDSVMVTGSPEDDQWRAVASAAPSLSLLGRADDAELILDALPSSTLLSTEGGNDSVDMAVDGSAWSTAATISTGSGDDTVTGGPEADTIRPGIGADVVDGGAGNDHLYVDVDAEPDTVRSGVGHDELHLSTPDHRLGALVDPGAPGGDGVRRNDDYAEFEKVWGTNGPDRFIASPSGMNAAGGFGHDSFVSGPGDDVFEGKWGEGDTVSYAEAAGPVTVAKVADFEDRAVGHGMDHLTRVNGLVGSPFPDDMQPSTAYVIRPGAGNDTVRFGLGGGTIVAEPGLDGNDTVLPSPSGATWDYSLRATPLNLTADGIANDGQSAERDNVAGAPRLDIHGGSGDDVIVGNKGRNSLVGNDGNDRISGGDSDDYLSGGDGNDVATGGSGNDSVNGGGGNDRIVEGSSTSNGGDDLAGDAGRDTLTYAGRRAGVSVSVDLRNDDGSLGEHDYVRADFEIIVGTSAADRLAGASSAEQLRGGGGADRLSGAGGADALLGEAGADWLTGGGGSDVLQGGGGNDRFFAVDARRDTLIGSYGVDLARRDRIDVLRSIEGRF